MYGYCWTCGHAKKIHDDWKMCAECIEQWYLDRIPAKDKHALAA